MTTMLSISGLIIYLWVYTEIDETMLAIEVQNQVTKELDNSLKEIWNSDKFKEIRKKHSSGNRNDISICIGCEIWNTKVKSIYYKNNSVK